jgi:hypothetical protein
MTEELVNVITQVADVVSRVQGIRQAPVNPNETQNVSPFAVTYLFSGRINVGPIGTRKNLHQIAVDLFVERTDLARNIAALNPFIDSLPFALLSEVSDGGSLFNSTIQTFDGISTTFLPSVDYGGKQMIGYRFVLENVKVLVNL